MERNRQQLGKQSFLSYQERNKKSLTRCGLTEAVPIDHSLQRIEVVRSLLTAGIPLAKLDKIRHLRKSGTTHLTSVSYLAEYIAFIQEQEADLLKKELAEAHSTCSVIFDGSTCLSEALAILLRFVDQDWHLKQRLVRFHIVSAQQLARALITCLSLKFNLSSDASMVAAIRDGAAVNGAALRSMKDVMYPKIVDLVCSAHTLDNVGNRFQTPLLTEFSQWWVSLFSKSPAARLSWRERTSSDIKTCNNTRWWRVWEVQNHLLLHFWRCGTFPPRPRSLSSCKATHT